MHTKTLKPKELEAGQKVYMANGDWKTVASVSRGFALMEREGKRRQGLMINWRDGGFSQVHPDSDCTVSV